MKMYCINHVFTEFLNSTCENSATDDFCQLIADCLTANIILISLSVYKDKETAGSFKVIKNSRERLHTLHN